ncbi:MAG: tetratricopeptide repeat protein [Promethearchaeota archaeon]
MAQIESLELNKIERLVNEGRFDDALQLINKFEEGGDISLYDKVSCNLFKGELLYQQGLFEDSFQLAKHAYKESLGLGKSLLTIDCLYGMAINLISQSKTKEADLLIKQGEELLEVIPQISPKDYKKREAALIYLKGLVFHPWTSQESNINLAVKYFQESLAIYESYDNKDGIVGYLVLISSIFNLIGELEKSFENIERALHLATELNRKHSIGWILFIKGTFYHLKGKIDEGVKLYQQSLYIFKELNNYNMVASLLNNLGGIFKLKGDLDHALECLEEAVELGTKFSSLKTIANFYDYLIQILIEKGEISRAEECLEKLDQISKQLNLKETYCIFFFNKALILKTSTRVINRGKAEELLKRVLELDPIYEFKIGALINLSDLLLIELKTTHNLEVLQEIERYINQLITIAENSGSYEVLGESYLLQAKLALISLELEDARRLLTQGQQIAEKFGLQQLAMKISNEHDDLLKELSNWEKLRESKASLPERMELARLNEQIEGIIKKRVIEVPKLPEETPMLLLILSEGGESLFSQYFIDDQSIDDHLFAGFLSAINSFINEIFSEGLDRVISGEHTILLNAMAPYFICYIFKGQSYSAHLKIKAFIDGIQSDKEIWDRFERFFKINQEIQLKDVPSLKTLIQEIFIETT